MQSIKERILQASLESCFHDYCCFGAYFREVDVVDMAERLGFAAHDVEMPFRETSVLVPLRYSAAPSRKLNVSDFIGHVKHLRTGVILPEISAADILTEVYVPPTGALYLCR